MENDDLIEADDEGRAERERLADTAVLRQPGNPDREVRPESDDSKIRSSGLRQFYEMRLTWSRWLIGWVTALISFQVVLTVAVGTSALDFRGYDTFLNLTMGQNFVQVVAMAVIVLRFLHSRDRDDAPH